MLERPKSILLFRDLQGHHATLQGSWVYDTTDKPPEQAHITSELTEKMGLGPNPSNSTSSCSPTVFMDRTDVSNSRQDDASISIDSTTGRMAGSCRFLPSFGLGIHIAYYCVDFSGSPV